MSTIDPRQSLLLNMACMNEALKPISEKLLDEVANKSETEPKTGLYDEHLIDLRWVKIVYDCYTRLRHGLHNASGSIIGPAASPIDLQNADPFSIFANEENITKLIAASEAQETRSDPNGSHTTTHYERRHSDVIVRALHGEFLEPEPGGFFVHYEANNIWHKNILEEQIRSGALDIFNALGQRINHDGDVCFEGALCDKNLAPIYEIYLSRMDVFQNLIWLDLMQSALWFTSLSSLLLKDISEHSDTFDKGIPNTKKLAPDQNEQLYLRQRIQAELAKNTLTGLPLSVFILPKKRYSIVTNSKEVLVEEKGPYGSEILCTQLATELRDLFEIKLDFKRGPNAHYYRLGDDEEAWIKYVTKFIRFGMKGNFNVDLANNGDLENRLIREIGRTKAKDISGLWHAAYLRKRDKKRYRYLSEFISAEK